MVRCEVDTTIDVTSKDLHLDTSHPEIVPIGHKDFGGDNMVNKPVVIVKMRRGQELKLKAVAVKVKVGRNVHFFQFVHAVLLVGSLQNPQKTCSWMADTTHFKYRKYQD